MFNNDVIALDLASENIKMLVGNKNRIKVCETFNISRENEGEELDLEYIEDSINTCLKENKVNTKEVSLAIHDQEIVIRHIEVPIMNEKDIRNAIEFELNQYLPGSGKNHYIDYEIIDKINKKDKKLYKLLVVSAPRDKIDKYAELADKLNLKLKSIDISSNCVARVFSNISKSNKQNSSIGVINIQNKLSNIIIMEKGKLFIEREVPFGINNLIRELENRASLSNSQAKTYLNKEININDTDENDEVLRRMQTMLDNVFASFNKVIQFYATGTGRTSRKLDYIYVIGEGGKINGISEYISRYFETPINIVDSLEKVKIKTKMPGDSNITKYIDAFGLLLRK